jgi:hypothetical protein
MAVLNTTKMVRPNVGFRQRQPRAEGFALLGLLLLLWLPARAQEITAPEDKVKAAFLYNFTKFVEWPTNVFATPDAPLVIGVLGRDPFGQVLDDTLKNKTVKNRRVVLVRCKRTEDAAGCHVLYICDSEQKKLPAILGELRGKPILTVSDLDGFSRQGGMIELIKSEDTIGFEINRKAADREGLRLSSKLLRLDRNYSGPGSGASIRPRRQTEVQ